MGNIVKLSLGLCVAWLIYAVVVREPALEVNAGDRIYGLATPKAHFRAERFSTNTSGVPFTGEVGRGLPFTSDQSALLYAPIDEIEGIGDRGTAGTALTIVMGRLGNMLSIDDSQSMFTEHGAGTSFGFHGPSPWGMGSVWGVGRLFVVGEHIVLTTMGAGTEEKGNTLEEYLDTFSVEWPDAP